MQKSRFPQLLGLGGLSVVCALTVGCGASDAPATPIAEPQVDAGEDAVSDGFGNGEGGGEARPAQRRDHANKRVAFKEPDRGLQASADARDGFPGSALAPEPLGGQLGAHGQPIGAGGLGTRGGGLGGGGIAEGLGGLGTTGTASGASGFGRGGGSFGGGPGTRASLGATAETVIDHGVNDVELSSRDHLSTFAVDVDTGSYTYARGQIRSGVRPHPHAVRVEEFVNAFDYELARPTGDDPFAIVAEVTPSPFHPEKHLLRVALKGTTPDIGDVPARLTFLVDTSCSMSGDRLNAVKDAMHVAVDHAGPEDTFAITTYAGGSRVLLGPTAATRKDTLHDAIDRLSTAGGTAMGSGMQLAYDQAQQTYLEGAENRVIVMSDGDANIGATSHAAILDGIAEHAGRGITLSTVGFGRGNYRDALMEQLADKGDGNYVYIDGPDEARRVFGEGLAATTRTIARDVKIQVDFDPEAVLTWRLIGYENRDVADHDFRNDAVDGGEIGAGHEVTALYELDLADARPTRFATVSLRAKKPGRDVPSREWSVSLDRSDVSPSWASASDDQRLAAGAALFAELLRFSPHVEEHDRDDVLRILQPLLPTRQVEELRELVRTYEQATTTGSTSDATGGANRRVLARYVNQFRYCYDKRKAVEPTLGSGTLQVSVQIDATGLVRDARILSSTLAAPEVESCVAARAQRIHFPGTGSAQTLRFPLTLGS